MTCTCKSHEFQRTIQHYKNSKTKGNIILLLQYCEMSKYAIIFNMAKFNSIRKDLCYEMKYIFVRKVYNVRLKQVKLKETKG